MSPRQQLDEQLDLLTNESDTHLILARVLGFLRAVGYPPVVLVLTLEQGERVVHTQEARDELERTIAEARRLTP